MDLTGPQAAVLLLVIAAAGCAAALLSWSLMRAARHPAPAMLVLSVSILSMTALIGGLVFHSDSALAIASAGLGALAGAVSATFTNRGDDERPGRSDRYGDP